MPGENGEIRLRRNITDYKKKKMEKLCGSKVSMVFQDPMLTLNPTIPVGKQITEAIIKNQKVSRGDAEKKAIEMLKLVEFQMQSSDMDFNSFFQAE